MNQVTLFIQKHVSIVPVLDLQDVADERIGCQRISESFLSILKVLSLGAFDIRRTKVNPEVVIEIASTMQCF